MAQENCWEIWAQSGLHLILCREIGVSPVCPVFPPGFSMD